LSTTGFPIPFIIYTHISCTHVQRSVSIVYPTAKPFEVCLHGLGAPALVQARRVYPHRASSLEDAEATRAGLPMIRGQGCIFCGLLRTRRRPCRIRWGMELLAGRVVCSNILRRIVSLLFRAM
jgi:hypothetical protein